MKFLSTLKTESKVFFLAVLSLAGFAFTADIFDLREELRFISCPYSYLDSNITTGISIAAATTVAEPCSAQGPVDSLSSVRISFLHLLPYGFRAPPTS